MWCCKVIGFRIALRIMTRITTTDPASSAPQVFLGASSRPWTIPQQARSAKVSWLLLREVMLWRSQIRTSPRIPFMHIFPLIPHTEHHGRSKYPDTKASRRPTSENDHPPTQRSPVLLMGSSSGTRSRLHVAARSTARSACRHIYWSAISFARIVHARSRVWTS